MTDVPWGVLLSGGLDSSLVASVALRLHADMVAKHDDATQVGLPACMLDLSGFGCLVLELPCAKRMFLLLLTMCVSPSTSVVNRCGSQSCTPLVLGWPTRPI